jgi:hypothetical protein
MKTKEYVLSIKLPIETLARLKGLAADNCSTLSAVARDLIFTGLAAEEKEHCFREHTEWMSAVLSRDRFCCVDCCSLLEIQAHHIVPKSQGGRDTLANGKTLCLDCHALAHTTETHRTALEDSNTLVPAVWRKAVYLAQYQRNCLQEQFWQEAIALWMTQRRKRTSPIVQTYIQTHLAGIPLRVLIKTALRLIGTPDILRTIPMRANGNRKEAYAAPPFVWD